MKRTLTVMIASVLVASLVVARPAKFQEWYFTGASYVALILNDAQNFDLTENVWYNITKNQGGTLSVTNNGYDFNAIADSTNVNGILPWAVIRDTTQLYTNNWAVYNGDRTALTSFTNYNTSSDDNTWGAATNARPPIADIRLASNDNYLNSLVMDNGVYISALQANNCRLNLTSGAILQTGGESVIRGGDYQGRLVDLTFGSVEGIFHTIGTLGIEPALTGYTPESISGSGGITKSGSGTLILGYNYYDSALLAFNNENTGPFTINEGTVRVQSSHDNALGLGTLVMNGGTLELLASGDVNYGRNTTINTNNVSINPDHFASGGAGDITYTFGTLALNADTLTVSGGTNAATNAILEVAFTGTTTFTTSPTFDVNNPSGGGYARLTLTDISGAFGLTKTGNGQLGINSTYSEAITLSAGYVGGTGTVGDITAPAGGGVFAGSGGTGTFTVDSLTLDTDDSSVGLFFDLSLTDTNTSSISVAGAFTKGTGTTFNVQATGGKPSTTYTIMDFASTTFTNTDFVMLNGPSGSFTNTATLLQYITDSSVVNLTIDDAYNTNMVANAEINNITRNQGGTLSITNNSYDLTINSSIAGVNGIIPWMVNNDTNILYTNNWVAPHPAFGIITAVTNYNTQNDGVNVANYWKADMNARPVYRAAGLNVQGDASVNSLIMDDTVWAYPNGGRKEMTFTSGGIFQTGGLSEFRRQFDSFGRILVFLFGTQEAVIYCIGDIWHESESANTVAHLQGSGGITKSGPGMFWAGYRSDTNVYHYANGNTGPLTINEGTWRIETTETDGLGSGGGIVMNGGTVDMYCTQNLDFAESVTINADCTLISGGASNGMAGVTYTLDTLAISNQTLTVSGGTNVASGTAGLTFSGATTLTGAPTFTVTTNGSAATILTLAGLVTDEGAGYDIIKEGVGQLTLSGSNLYANTYVNAGTLSVENNNALPSDSILYVTNSAVANLGNITNSIDQLFLGGASQVGGTYGSSSSAATFTNDTYFTGVGVLDVALGYWTDPNTYEVLLEMETTNALSTLDTSGNGNHAQRLPSVASGPAWTLVGSNAFGRAEYSFSFDAVDDYLQVTNPPVIATGMWMFWCKPDTTNAYCMAGQDVGGFNDDAYFYQYTGKPNFNRDDAGTSTSPRIDADDYLATNAWSHVAVYWGTNGMGMYVNGILQADTDASTGGVSGASAPLVVGRYRFNDTPVFDGEIDQFMVHDGLLSSSAVYNIFQYTHPTNNLRAR